MKTDELFLPRPEPKRIIVCGSRHWRLKQVVFDEIDREIRQMFGNTSWVEVRLQVILMHGGCPTGADRFADDYAAASDIGVKKWPADWASHGKSAGPKRNLAMAQFGANVCLAFWDGESSGTLNMIQCATRCNVPVRIVPHGWRRETPPKIVHSDGTDWL